VRLLRHVRVVEVGLGADHPQVARERGDAVEFERRDRALDAGRLVRERAVPLGDERAAGGGEGTGVPRARAGPVTVVRVAEPAGGVALLPRVLARLSRPGLRLPGEGVLPRGPARPGTRPGRLP
jgi:hypothetical protein